MRDLSIRNQRLSLAILIYIYIPASWLHGESCKIQVVDITSKHSAKEINFISYNHNVVCKFDVRNQFLLFTGVKHIK